MSNHTSRQVGIDDMALFVPKHYLPIQLLANERGIEAAKLQFGLGLQKMAVPAPNEDAATFAANALLQLLLKNKLDPCQIGRIYMGTESAVDGAKPTATYAVQMVEQAIGKPRAFKNCDVLDMTFACIGGVDALQNALDWVRCNPEKMAIVIASDMAKYELESTGEYTQGAGAVAMLVKRAPRLLAFSGVWGVGMESVHDFFKPRRAFPKSTLNGHSDALPYPDAELHIFRETPVFDGPYSNLCYTNRVLEAMEHFRGQLPAKSQPKSLFDRWDFLAFHLPYAAHGRRIGADLFALETERAGTLAEFCKKNKIEKIEADADNATKAEFMKALSKSEGYRQWAKQKMGWAQTTSGEVGNMYTASIFLGLMGILEGALNNEIKAENRKIGFFAYGSGSKSKVFEAKIQKSWKEAVSKFGLSEQLQNRQSIDFETYEQWHKLEKNLADAPTTKGFALKHIAGQQEKNLEGTRVYEMQE